MEQNPLEQLMFPQLIKKFPNFLKSQGLLHNSQVPATCLHPQPATVHTL